MKRTIDSWKTIRHNGGIWKSIKCIFFRDDLKIGTLVGEDEYGNKYYENDKYFMPRNRWVNYADRVRLEYDASQVPAEWHGWLHNRHELPPHEQLHRPRHPWMHEHSHTENETGTAEQYVPYSTTPPKIAIWTSPKARQCDPCSPSPTEALDRCQKPHSENSDSTECGSKPAERSSGSCGNPAPITGSDCGNTAEIGGTSKGGCDRSSDSKKPKTTACEKPTKVFH